MQIIEKKTTRPLGDTVWFPNGKKEAKMPDLTTVSEEVKEQELITKGDMLNTGGNINNSAVVGSSAMTMHIDLPGVLFLSDTITEIQYNVTQVTKYIKNLTTTMERFKLIKENDSDTLAKIRESAQLGREARNQCSI